MAVIVWTLLIFLVISADCCFIMMRGAETIECSSTQELTFQVTRYIDNEKLIIAECHPNEKLCFLRNQSYESNYVIANTSTGGLLVVRNFNQETFGVYKCFETYNLKKYKTIEINSSTVPPDFFQPDTQDLSNTKPIVFNQLKAMKNGFVPLECFSSAHTMFQFMAYGTLDSISIATCDIKKQSCYLEDDTLETHYAVTYGGNKGLLLVHLNEATYGTYRCCETHNLSNCDATTIVKGKTFIPLRKQESHTDTDMGIQPTMHTFSSDISGVLNFCLGTLGILVITLIAERVIHIVIKCREELFRQKQAGNDEERKPLKYNEPVNQNEVS